MRFVHLVAFTFLAALLAVLTLACSGDDEENAAAGGGVTVTSGAASSTPAETSPTPGPNTPTATATPSEAGDTASMLEVTAENLAFDKDTLTAPPKTQVELVFHNQDQAEPHNIAVYRTESADEEIFKGEIIRGIETITYEFETPVSGSYFFRCDVHPDIMFGEIVVQGA